MKKSSPSDIINEQVHCLEISPAATNYIDWDLDVSLFVERVNGYLVDAGHGPASELAERQLRDRVGDIFLRNAETLRARFDNMVESLIDRNGINRVHLKEAELEQEKSSPRPLPLEIQLGSFFSHPKVKRSMADRPNRVYLITYGRSISARVPSGGPDGELWLRSLPYDGYLVEYDNVSKRWYIDKRPHRSHGNIEPVAIDSIGYKTRKEALAAFARWFDSVYLVIERDDPHQKELAKRFGREPQHGYHLVEGIAGYPGRIIEEPIGTPGFCSPSSEAYWSA